jgi:hypothetical protein
MHRIQHSHLSQTNIIVRIGIPETHSDSAGIVCEHDFEVSGCGSGALAWLRYVMEVDDAAGDLEILGARLEGTDG